MVVTLVALAKATSKSWHAVGAVHHHPRRLAHAKINATAADAISAGKGRCAMLKPKDYARATRTLGAR